MKLPPYLLIAIGRLGLFRRISDEMEKQVPHKVGFGRFRQPTRAESEQYWTAKMRAEDGSAFFVPLPDDAAEAWWQSELKLLRLLDAKAQHDAGVARLLADVDERAQNWLLSICVGVCFVAFFVALYAMRYLK